MFKRLGEMSGISKRGKKDMDASESDQKKPKYCSPKITSEHSYFLLLVTLTSIFKMMFLVFFDFISRNGVKKCHLFYFSE